MREVCHNVKPFPQPSPKRNPGGDCFACALKAVIDHLFSDRPVNFNVVWEAFERETTSGTKHLSNVWPTMYTAAYAIRDHDYDIEVYQDLVIPCFNVQQWSHAWWWTHALEWEWAYRLEAWLAAGWVALCEMSLEGVGPTTTHNGRILHNNPDHFVVVDGQRHFWKKSEVVEGAASLAHETHVVCSVKGAYWIDTEDILRKHGVAGLWLVRKDVRRD